MDLYFFIVGSKPPCEKHEYGVVQSLHINYVGHEETILFWHVTGAIEAQCDYGCPIFPGLQPRRA
jgi:hypothetical protein